MTGNEFRDAEVIAWAEPMGPIAERNGSPRVRIDGCKLITYVRFCGDHCFPAPRPHCRAGGGRQDEGCMLAKRLGYEQMTGLLVPIVNVIVFFYLAFRESPNERKLRSLKRSGGSGVT